MRPLNIDVSEEKGWPKCAKPNCNETKTQRHHIRHEYLFVANWLGRRNNEERYRKLCIRYWQFRPSDIVHLCDKHHKEIHLAYNFIINQQIISTTTPIAQWSWEAAELVMREFQKTCRRWLKKETPGVSTKEWIDRHLAGILLGGFY